jgi:hypothetical protein
MAGLGWRPATEDGELLPHAMSMKEGIERLRLVQEGSGGKWKWSGAPGDGKKFAVFACNNHISCAASNGRLMRCVLSGGVFVLQMKGEHGLELTERKRKNSPLNWEQESQARLMLKGGMKAGPMHTAWTDSLAGQLEKKGEDPLSSEHKRPQGGLKGAQQERVAGYRTSNLYRIRCILSVFFTVCNVF